MENRFNLIDEAWIPIADRGKMSLQQVFSDPGCRALGGNPVEKIALLKLLLAIAQAACTPENDSAWRELGAEGAAARCRTYLARWHDRFWLRGERPFLQMPAIVGAKQVAYGALAPWVAAGNTTVLNHGQVAPPVDDPEAAMLLLCQMGFALSGKKVDNSITLTPGYPGKRNAKDKPSSGRTGPSVGYCGFLHSFLLGDSLRQTVWLNLLTQQQVAASSRYPIGVGVPPWEEMPAGEDDTIARRLKQTLMGRLVPLCRFCLLTDGGVHYSEGIAHPDYRDGAVDPSVAADYSGRKPRVLWASPDKRPWRELTALLGFLDQQKTHGMECWQVHAGLDRARDTVASIGVWSGGLRVSSNAGEQYASGSDDFVASETMLQTADLGSGWFAQLKSQMSDLDLVAKRLLGCTAAYFHELKTDGAELAARCVSIFWQMCERDFQDLVDGCETTSAASEARDRLRLGFARNALDAYDRQCPRDTARQLDAWAKCRPTFNDYVRQEA